MLLIINLEYEIRYKTQNELYKLTRYISSCHDSGSSGEEDREDCEEVLPFREVRYHIEFGNIRCGKVNIVT